MSDHGKCCEISLAAYVRGARTDLAGLAFTPGHDTNVIHHLLLEIDRLSAGLGFYADETHWDSRELDIPEGLCESGPAWDRGAHARSVLAARRTDA